MLMDAECIQKEHKYMNDSRQTVVMTGGTSSLSLLCLMLIGLKLTGYISIPWYLVLAPVWVPWAILIPIAFLALWWTTRK